MELRGAGDDLTAVLHGIKDGVTVQAPDGSLLFVNEAAARLSGYPSAEAMLATPVAEIARGLDLADEAGRPVPLDQLPGRQALRGVSPPEVILRVRSRVTGEERWSSLAATPIFNPGGQLRFVVTVFRDVTALKRAEIHQRFLAEAGTLLSSSLDYETTLASVARLAVPEIGDWCAVHMVRDGRIDPLAVAHVDPARVRLATELQKRYPPDPDAPVGVANVIRTGRSELYPDIPDSVLEASARDAGHLAILRELGLVSAMLVPLSARGRTLGAITIVSAESGRRYVGADLGFVEALAARAALAVDNASLYSQLQREVRARDEFLAAASHDLKNPLASIKGAAQVLGRRLARPDALDLERLRSGLATVDYTATRMAKLVDGLLDITRVQLGHTLELERAPTDLAGLARAVAAESQQATERHRIRVEGLDRLVGEWDAARLERVLSNLLDNAIKYSPGGGDIEVTVAREDGVHHAWAELGVHDRGVGVPPEDRARIFERFQRGRNVAGRIGGAGIGLAGARQVVEQHGGTIAATDRPGGGTSFIIRLPLSEARPQISVGQEPRSP